MELLRSSGINNLVAVSDIPAFCLDYKLPTTLNIELATHSKKTSKNGCEGLFITVFSVQGLQYLENNTRRRKQSDCLNLIIASGLTL